MKEFLSSESATDVLARANTARDSGDRKGAIELYEEIIDRSDDKNLITASIDGLQSFGETERVIAGIETALKQWPNSPMFLIRAATARENNDNYAGALPYLRKITELYPNKWNYWLRLGATCAAANRWKDAEIAYARVLTIMPLEVSALIGRGDALVQLERVDEAFSCYRRVAKLLPDHAEATLRLGNLLSATNNLDDAIDVLRRAVHLNPKNASAHVSLGSTLYYRGYGKEGLALCRKAMELEPELTIAREATGMLLLEGGHITEATKLLDSVDRALASIPGLIAKYHIAVLSEDIEAAERALQRTLSLNPHHGEARHFLAAMHGEPVARPTDGFVENVFARLAYRYDQRMSVDLDYQIPRLVAETIIEESRFQSPADRWLDLGCGTGLVAAAFDGVVECVERIGVDLTQGMLDQAAQKNLYDHIILGDAVDALREVDGRFDLITAIDLLAYIGNAAEFFELVADRLERGGLFVYTHENAEEGRYKLRPSGRFAYDTEYLEQLESKTSLSVMARIPTTLRYEKGEEVPGNIVMLSSASQ